ncbi:MAG TPA: hypothetical protein VKH19_04250 [Gemmatimonadaceae bacterium]|nr:hypothetical protein [Gemmatimonadaceae bacterium]
MSQSAATGSTTVPRPLAAVRALLGNVVDYAGLFPPASLSMTAAASAYSEHRSGGDAWLLGRFVLPVARLEEFERDAAALLPREGARSWALSALLSGDVEVDLQRVEEFNARHRDARLGAVQIDTVELKTHTTHEIMHAAELLERRFDTYMEIPVVEDPAERIAAIAAAHAKAKIRTGGVTPDLFPPSSQVVRFVTRCLGHDVAFKATAGLHHSWRAEYPLTYASDAARGTMFGFLNLLLCVAALHQGLDDAVATQILEERDRSQVVFDAAGATWRGHRVGGDALRRARDTMTSFGSCSFAEPADDLRAAHLL